jgi:dUTP pyrophosphatase
MMPTRGQRLHGGGFAGQPGRGSTGQPGAGGVDEAAADVGHHRHAKRGELLDRGLLDEALDAVVAGVHLQHHCHVGVLAPERPAVVGRAGAVGGAHVDQFGARLLHHLGHPEAAADLDALATAHQHLATVGQCCTHQQHGGGVVVHDDGGLGAAHAGEQLADGALARPALAGGEVELDVHGTGLGVERHRGSPEVGVQQNAGGVHHVGEQGAAECFGPGRCTGDVVVGDGLAGDVDADGVRQPAGCQRAGERIDAGRSAGRRHGRGRCVHPVERRRSPSPPAPVPAPVWAAPPALCRDTERTFRLCHDTDEGGAGLGRAGLGGEVGRRLCGAMVDIPIVRLDPDLPLPAYTHPGDAGLDLRARIDTTVPAAGGRVLVPTGVAIAIPEGHAGWVLPRSGLALEHGIALVNAPGLIDAAYRGELKVILLNTDPHRDFVVHRGDRIAQLVIQRFATVQWAEVDTLEGDDRGGGFGHSGRR